MVVTHLKYPCVVNPLLELSWPRRGPHRVTPIPGDYWWRGGYRSATLLCTNIKARQPTRSRIVHQCGEAAFMSMLSILRKAPIGGFVELTIPLATWIETRWV